MASFKNSVPRKLFELLKEQQEPFLLQNHGFQTKRNRKCNILRSFLAKAMCLSVIKRRINLERLESRGESSMTKFHRLIYNSRADNVDVELENIEHSPLSVLGFRYSNGGSSDLNHSMESLSSTSRLNSPTTPACTLPKCGSPQEANKRELHQPRHLLLDFLKEMEAKYCDPYDNLCQNMSKIAIYNDIFPFEKQKEDDLIFTRLLNKDISETNADWTLFQIEKRKIGTELGCIMFDELREECVVDMLCFHCTLEA